MNVAQKLKTTSFVSLRVLCMFLTVVKGGGNSSFFKRDLGMKITSGIYSVPRYGAHFTQMILFNL